MRGPTKAELTERANYYQRAAHVAEVCLADLLAGRVQWFQAEGLPHRIGLVRADGAAGGYVIHEWTGDQGRPVTSASLLEEFEQSAKNATMANGGDEAWGLLGLVNQAVKARNAALDAKYRREAGPSLVSYETQDGDGGVPIRLSNPVKVF